MIESGNHAGGALAALPNEISAHVRTVQDWRKQAHLRAVLFEGEADALLSLTREVASLDGAILPIQSTTSAALARGDDYDLNRLLEECSISTNTAAAGGNASLMSIG